MDRVRGGLDSHSAYLDLWRALANKPYGLVQSEECLHQLSNQ